jgi:hypothetical protein
MAGDASAYAILGLAPDAEPAAIDQAYRRLIKRFHPDRDGGDAARAAEINRAYRELRGLPPKNVLVLNDAEPLLEPRAGAPWAGALAALVAATGLLVFIASVPKPGRAVGAIPVAGAAGDAMDAPLAVALVDGAVADAVRLSRRSDEMAMASTSRDCHERLRRAPSLDQLDRCAAFDDAVVQLQDRDPLRNRGPFGEIAVTGRQWSAAQTLSSDNLAIDSRLDRIRLRVELALAPAPVLPEVD